jgi:hypothetical protein
MQHFQIGSNTYTSSQANSPTGTMAELMVWTGSLAASTSRLHIRKQPSGDARPA